MAFDENGQPVYGVLATDRPHQLKAHVLFDFPFGTSLGASWFGASGTYAAPGHLIFDFRLTEQPWSADRLAQAIEDAEQANGPARWPAVVMGNHDQPRQATRLSRGRSRDREAIARAAAVLLLTLRGTPFLYYGEEIGLGDVRVPRWEMQDPPARRYWPLPVWFDRDRCRGPMPWTPGRNGGFTSARPWTRMAPDHATRNVASQGADPASILALYRRLIWLRRELPALTGGAFRWHVPGRDGGHSPGEAPAVAVEHGQGPQVHAASVQAHLQGIGQRVQVGPAATVLDTLGRARGA